MENDNSVQPIKTSHTSKAVIATIIIFAIIATAGLAVGIYGIVTSLRQSNDLADLKHDINNLTEQLASKSSTKQQTSEYPTVIVNDNASGTTNNSTDNNSSATNTNTQATNNTNTVEIKEDSVPGSTTFPRAFILSDGSYAILNANYEIIVQSAEHDIVEFISCDDPKCVVRTTDGGSRGYVYFDGEFRVGKTMYN